MVFDWSVSNCESNDIPDEAARAFRDSSGQDPALATHFVNYRRIADTTLDGPYTHPCTKTMSSSNSAEPVDVQHEGVAGLAVDPRRDRRLRARPHGVPGRANYLSGCTTYGYQCWWNSITSAVSTDSGATFTQPRSRQPRGHDAVSDDEGRAPTATSPRATSCVSGDGWFYAMFRANAKGAQQMGTCLMRTRDLSDPRVWRAWNGSTFSVRFVNPYLVTGLNPADHVCAPVDFIEHRDRSPRTSSTAPISRSGCWSACPSATRTTHTSRRALYYALSDDLLEWTDLELLMAAEITWWTNCTQPDPIKEVVDPRSIQHVAELHDRRKDRAALLHLVPPERLQRHAGPRPGPRPDRVHRPALPR